MLLSFLRRKMSMITAFLFFFLRSRCFTLWVSFFRRHCCFFTYFLFTIRGKASFVFRRHSWSVVFRVCRKVCQKMGRHFVSGVVVLKTLLSTSRQPSSSLRGLENCSTWCQTGFGESQCPFFAQSHGFPPYFLPPPPPRQKKGCTDS